MPYPDKKRRAHKGIDYQEKKSRKPQRNETQIILGNIDKLEDPSNSNKIGNHYFTLLQHR